MKVFRCCLMSVIAAMAHAQSCEELPKCNYIASIPTNCNENMATYKVSLLPCSSGEKCCFNTKIAASPQNEEIQPIDVNTTCVAKDQSVPLICPKLREGEKSDPIVSTTIQTTLPPPEAIAKGTSPSAAPQSDVDTGAIVGATVGGLLAVAVAALAFVQYRRRRSHEMQPHAHDFNEDPDVYLEALSPPKELNQTVQVQDKPIIEAGQSSTSSVNMVPVTKSKTSRSLLDSLSSRQDLKQHWLPLDKLKPNQLKGGFHDLRSVHVDGKKMALKCLDYKQATTTQQKSFFKAFHMIQPLEHSNLTRVLGISLVSHQVEVCIATEFMERGSLGAVLGNVDLELSLRQRVQMGRDIALALEYLHHKNIVYNEVHPDKVLLNTSLTCKLNVLHLMRPIYEARRICTITCGAGITSYLAPERRGSSPSGATSASDIYSLGVILSQLVTREAPHKNLIHDVGFAHADAHLHQNHAQEPHTLPATIPDTLRSIIQRCWNEVPSARPHINEIVDVLKGIVDNSNVEQFV